MAQDFLPGRRHRDTAIGAFENHHAEFGFEFLDLPAQGRLTDETVPRGAAEVAAIGDRDNVFEVAQVHGSSIGNDDH
jgi:hypothetical protein